MSQRISLNLPIKMYNDVKRLALKIGMPSASLISAMIIDVFIRRDSMEFEHEKRKSGKRNLIHIKLDDNMYNDIFDYYTNVLSNYKTFTELALDCIEYQLKKRFDTILEVDNPVHVANKRISNTIDSETKNIDNEVRENHKVNHPVEDYLNLKSCESGVSKNILKKFYVTRAINDIIKVNEDEREDFSIPQNTEFFNTYEIFEENKNEC